MEVVVASWIGGIALGAFLPKPHQAKRGFLASLTRSTQYFTLYGQGLASLAWLTQHEELASAAVTIETLVFLLYHGISWFNPSLLSYESPELTKAVTGWRCPSFPYSLVWFALHIQHTYSPIVTWLTFTKTRYSLHWLALYVVWNHFCWWIQDVPSYPIQSDLYRLSLYKLALIGFFLLGMTIESVSQI